MHNITHAHMHTPIRSVRVDSLGRAIRTLRGGGHSQAQEHAHTNTSTQTQAHTNTSTDTRSFAGPFSSR